MKQHLSSQVLAVVCLAAAPLTVSAAVHGEQSLRGTEVWRATDNPHRVTGRIHVERDARLVLEPGVVVHFDADSHAGLLIEGSLEAGALGAERVFLGTEAAHRAYLANPLSSTPFAERKYWRGIEFRHAGAPSHLRNVVLDSAWAGVRATDSIVEVSASELRQCGWAVLLQGPAGDLRLTNSRLTDNRIALDLAAGARAVALSNRFERNQTAISDTTGALNAPDAENVFAGNRVDRALAWNATSGATSVSEINVDTHWSASLSPINLSGSVRVAAGVRLTIDPGVVIRFAPGAGNRLLVEGRLEARGTESQPIWFTSQLDDQAGAATVPAAEPSREHAAEWGGLVFQSPDAGSRLEFAVVRHADIAVRIADGAANQAPVLRSVVLANNATGLRGSAAGATSSLSQSRLISNGIAVEWEAGAAVITGSEFRANAVAIYLAGGKVEVSGNAFADNLVAISLGDGSAGSIAGNSISTSAGGVAFQSRGAFAGQISSNRLAGDGLNATEIPGSTGISGSVTWNNTSTPYVINPEGGVYINNGATLTISPGVVVKFRWRSGYNGAYIRVYGTLLANGSSAQPIYFTSLKDDSIGGDTNADSSATTPAAGDWAGLLFEANSSGSLSYAVLRYAGGGYAALYVNTGTAQPVLGAGLQITDSTLGLSVVASGSSLTLSGATLARNTTAVQLLAGTTVVTGNTFSLNGTAIDAGYGARGSISGNTITTPAGGKALQLNAGYLGTLGANTMTGEGRNYVQVSGSLSGTNSWTNTANVYVIDSETGSVYINSGASLTIAPGVVVKFRTRSGHSQVYMRVSGTLAASGTAALPITFTSFADDTAGGDTNSDGSAAVPAAGDWGGLHFEADSSGTLSYLTLRYAGGGYAALDIASGGAQPVIGAGVQVSDSTIGIIVSGSATNVTLSGITLARNGTGIHLQGGSATVTANTLNANTTGINADWGARGTISGNLINTPANGRALLLSAGFLGSVGANTMSGAGANYITVSGSVSGNVVWANTASPYVVDTGQGSVYVNNGATLTVSPGVVVKFRTRSGYSPANIQVAGTLSVNGSVAQPVVFTSFVDDTVGGDTNADAGATSPAPGDWGGILFANGSQGSLSNLTLRYGGSSWAALDISSGVAGQPVIGSGVRITDSGTGVRVSGSLTSVTLSGLTIERTTLAISLESGSATVTSNTLNSNVTGIQAYSGMRGSIAGNTITTAAGGKAFVIDAGYLGSIGANTVSGAGTNYIAVGGTVSGDVTWGNLAAPYVIDAQQGSVYVSSGARLTILPGVVVKFRSRVNNGAPNLQVYGTLVADGTAEKPIYFTSLADDTIGGDTGADGSAVTPLAGDWSGLLFRSGAAGSLSRAVIRYGGASYGALDIATGTPGQPVLGAGLSITDSVTGIAVSGAGSNPAISGLTIERCTTGIAVNGGSATVTSNTLRNNQLGISAGWGASGSISGNTIVTPAGGRALALNGGYLGSLGANTMSGAGLNYVEVGGTLSGTATWNNLANPYVIDPERGSLTINTDGHLTIAPGVVVKFRYRQNYTPASIYVYGALDANGTSAQPIYFTSLYDDTVGGDTNGDGSLSTPAPGNWSGIRWAAESGGSLSQAVLRYGGGSLAALDIATGGARPTLGAGIQITDNLTGLSVRENGTNVTISGINFARNTTALSLTGGTASVTGNTFSANTTAISAGSGARGSISGNTITTPAGGKALSVDGGYLGSIGANTMTGAGMNYVSVGGSITGDVVWSNLANPYVIDPERGSLSIQAGSSLTIAPGVVVKFRYTQNYSTAYIYVYGRLTADGSVSAPIYFTSLADDTVGGDTGGDGSASLPQAGQWGGIQFAADSSGSLSRAVLRYGGSNRGALDLATGSAQPTLGAGIRITDSTTGLSVSGTGTAVTIDGVVFERNGTGVSVNSGAAIIRNCTLTHNTTGVYASQSASGSIAGNTIVTLSGGRALRLDAGYLGSLGANTMSGAGINYAAMVGYISGNVVWANQSGAYVIDADLGNVTIASGGSLTISPGVVVKFRPRPNSSGASISVSGSLVLNGSAAQPVYLTSLSDDTVAGDTGGDGTATTPAASDWSGLRFNADSRGSITNAVLRYGGSSWAALDIASANAQPVLGSGVQITDSTTGIAVSSAGTNVTLSGLTLARNTTAIYVNSGSAAISGGTFNANATAINLAAGAAGSVAGNTITTPLNGRAITMSAGYLGSIGVNTFSGAGNNYTEVGGTLNGTAVWSNTTNPYVIDPSQGVYIGSSGRLTLSPGVMVKFRVRPSYSPGHFYVYGTLLSNGTAAQPVRFTSLADDTVGGDTGGDGSSTTPALGDWSCLCFQSDAKGSLSNTIFRHGGDSYTGAVDIRTGVAAQPLLGTGLQFNDSITGLRVNGSTNVVSLSGASFSRNTTAISIESGQASLTGNAFLSNGVAINLASSSSGTVTGNTITTASGGSAIRLNGSFNGTIGSNTVSGAGLNGIEISSTWLSGSLNWAQAGLPYVVGSVTVQSGASLTIAPGVVVKFRSSSARLSVSGTLNADGTTAQPIYFTSFRDDTVSGDSNGDATASTPAAGDWGGLSFQNGAKGSISNAVIRYSGRDGEAVSISTRGAQPTISRTTISDNLNGVGAYWSGTAPMLSGNTFARNGIAVHAVGSAMPVVYNNSIAGNSTGVQNDDSSVTVDARVNYWGAADGPSGAGPGSGDRVSANVSINPFLGETSNAEHGIVAVWPNRGGDSGSTTVTVFGMGFAPGATVALSRTGQSNIIGSLVSVTSDGLSAGATFALAGQARGAWDVKVVNPDGFTSTRTAAFTIEAAQQPELWADVVSKTSVRVGRSETVQLLYGNRGNVDAGDVVVWLAVKGNVTVTPEGPYLVAMDTPPVDPVATRDGFAYYWFYSSHLRGGSARSVIVRTVANSAAAIEMRAGIVQAGQIFGPESNPLSTSRRSFLARADQVSGATPERAAFAPQSDNPRPGDSVFKLSDPADPAPVGHVGIFVGTVSGQACSPRCVVDFITQGGSHMADGAVRMVSLDQWASASTYMGSGRPAGMSDTVAARAASDAVSYYQQYQGQTLHYSLFPTLETAEDCVSWLADRYRAAGYLVMPWMDWYSPGGVYELVMARPWPEVTYRLLSALINAIPESRDFFSILHALEALGVTIQAVASVDPNDKSGAQGTGDGRFLTGAQPLRYTIYFENLETATAPAQEVLVTDQLDPSKLDFTTFSLGQVTFGTRSIVPSSGSSAFTADVDLRPAKNLIARVQGNLNFDTGLLTWRFLSLDPVTLQPTEDALAGFLPPNRTSPEGQGSVSFTVKPKSAQVTGAQIRNRASIKFDENAVILTPEWLNTIDNSAPSSQVAALNSQSATSFTVGWSGADVGAGISDYTIYVSDNGGAYSPWLTMTSSTQATFSGVAGHTYRFFSLARDRAGNAEAMKTAAEATTQISGVTYSISGNAGVAGATLALSGSSTSSTTADSSGAYSFTALAAGGNYTVTPTKTYYTFTPASRTFNSLAANQTASFTTALNTFTISGNAGVAAATVAISGSSTSSTTADSSGAFSFSGLAAGGNYTVTPSKSGWVFTPPSRSVSGLAANQTFSFTAIAAPAAVVSLYPTALSMGAVSGGSAVTPTQTVRVALGGSSAAWTATPNVAWLVVTSGSGSGDGQFTVDVNPAALPAIGTATGKVTVSVPSASLTADLPCTLTVTAAATAPIGAFETPTDGSTVASSIAVTGWTLDDIGVTGVKIWRDPVGAEAPGSLVFIGDAVFVPGARPDVEAAYPALPLRNRAGWGYMMLTYGLPNSNGVFKIYAIATDADGHQTTLGSKTITVDNVHATKPFGAMATPKQGATVSGAAYVNQGWALTPQPGSIPTDGSTIRVFIDGVLQGTVTYNNLRADVQALFPSYANSAGAGGYRVIDTTALTNGLHTIAWSVRDNLSRVDGVGSRYFTVLNGVTGARPTAQLAQSARVAARLDKTPGRPMMRTGWDSESELRDLGPLSVEELERIEIVLPAGDWVAYERVAGERRSLPVGLPPGRRDRPSDLATGPRIPG